MYKVITIKENQSNPGGVLEKELNSAEGWTIDEVLPVGKVGIVVLKKK